MEAEDDKLVGTGLYEGFNLGFFAYTLIWPILINLVLKIRSKYLLIDHNAFRQLLKIYFVLSAPYFLFGFGPFSNRYAMIAWFMIPLLQFHIINIIRIRKLYKNLSFVVFLIAFSYFILVRMQFFHEAFLL